MMKIVLFALITITILTSCKNDSVPLNEDFHAICFVSNGGEIDLGSGVFMNRPQIHFIQFVYHDTVFQVHIKNQKSTYSWLKFRNKGKDSLLSVLEQYDKTSLKQQLKSMQETNVDASCAPEGDFLFKKDEKFNFGLFLYNDYSNWLKGYRYKEVKLKNTQFPKVYQNIYHTFNSKQWDYLMSDDYHYKDVRTYGKHDLFFQ